LIEVAKAGDTKLVFEIDNARFRELQWGYVGSNNNATVPLVIIGVSMEIHPLEEESDLRAEITPVATDYA